MSSFGRYTHAIVCRISAEFGADGATGGAVDVPLAQKQHECFVRQLRQLQLDVIELPADPTNPRSPLVGECAVVCNGIVLLCRPSLQQRRSEVNAIKAVVKRDLELPFVEIPDLTALLHGGDVLFTGREFFVGVSERTNLAGAKALAAAFPEYSCAPVEMPPPPAAAAADGSSGSWCLQQLVTVAAPDILCVANTKHAQSVLKCIERQATFRYSTLTVPEPSAANCVFVNGALLHQHGDESPAASKVFESRLGGEWLRPLHLSQICRAGGCLSTCCILVRKTSRIEL